MRTSRTLHLWCLLTSLLAAQGCGEPSPPARAATPEETARLYPALAAARSVTLSKAEPHPSCRPLGAVRGGGWSPDEAYDALRTEAARLGANYVVMDGIAGGLFGRAFLCPQVVMASPPAAPQAQESPAACQPACSPGYTCVSGQCVSACNPACSTAQRCGPDRLCHPAD